MSDAYSNVSGSIDALIWILFGPVLWGAVFWLIYRAVKKRKESDETTAHTNPKNTTSQSQSNTQKSLHSPIENDWDAPRHSSGYVRNAGWYADPSGKFKKRYFNGKEWTDDVLDPSSSKNNDTPDSLSETTASEMQDWRLPLNADGSLKSPGYYWDPSGEFQSRYFDGTNWTLKVLHRGKKLYLSPTHTTMPGNLGNSQRDSSNDLGYLPESPVANHEQEMGNLNNESVLEMSATLSRDLQGLADLYERGLLSDDEFTQAKRRLLNN